jgi:hypothetical protein
VGVQVERGRKSNSSVHGHLEGQIQMPIASNGRVAIGQRNAERDVCRRYYAMLCQNVGLNLAIIVGPPGDNEPNFTKYTLTPLPVNWSCVDHDLRARSFRKNILAV